MADEATDEEGPTPELMTQLYEELRKLAEGYFRRQPQGHTLQPTALVHEAFLKLTAGSEAYADREHFLAVAATAMRQVLASHARRRRASKRGGDQLQVTFTGLELPDLDQGIDLVALDDVLGQLESLHPRQARVVAYRFFGGLTVPEISRVLDVSVTTVEKDWRRARAWLASELEG